MLPRLPVYLSDIWGCVLLCVDLCAEGSSPPATLYHGVHGRRHLLIAWVWTGTAGLLLVLNLLGLLLERKEGMESTNRVQSCSSSSRLSQGCLHSIFCAQLIQTREYWVTKSNIFFFFTKYFNIDISTVLSGWLLELSQNVNTMRFLINNHVAVTK